ncbi:hypothetical protein GLOIN_2v1764524 [Rhizophagus irregularis DAOM 181602=DAOM 197198]|uniref:Uncharacterized protein n=1 Tax=Rhizophagus irregularis (strain DAOM 181602 / DAOM 197198 / MUCL 43194) TaxID=747089 RepID=A0A2P4QRX0_RHIID|nr:hypothetical protein GLOIN_2v1764524 [Rhizophagus irregularis DAOM 181602=DAOM 197198]POG80404.1 hypothetical protein GLOIN_2v1764524 [Rhizophagus irregularis DAOM 181602=DAOM 197198]|eukprot:XP_025187270.1 hypothetical protein GLOIN_2v1764524 [Rhizophagus irregularis DAOM 181602=DAOM 197198]
MLGKIKERISDLYGKHQYLIDILPEYNKKDFVAVLDRETTGVALWSNALSCLARYLNECFGKSSVILIDEYDWPMENSRGFYDKSDDFFRTMYSSIAKENRNVDKILFVGTFPLRQSSFLSGLNNVVAYPMHERPNHSGRAIFSDTFGFTEEEIKHLLEKKHQNKKLKELRLYYNGYRTSTGVHIYNPHSVISCLEKNEIDNYWINSGSATTFDQDVIESVGQDESVVIGMEYTKTNEIYESLFKKDIVTFCNKFPLLYMELMSCFDIAGLKKGKLHETWYHIFVLGTLAMYHGVEYRVESNREAGDGRPDVRIIPINQNKTDSITYEFKRTENEDSDIMKHATKVALDQIFDKCYRMSLPNHVKEIVEVGIAFCDKVAFVSARCLKRKKEIITKNEDWEVVSEWETGKFIANCALH